MLWQLVKFKFKINFKRSGIALLVASYLLYALIVYLLSISHIPFALYLFNISGILLLSMQFIFYGIFSSFFIQKSDIDFFFMLPFDEKELKKAFLLFAFLSNLLLTSFAAIFLFPAISYLFLLVALITAVMNSFAFFAFKRKILVVIVGAWMLSSILKFPFSPFSMVFGYVYGYYILAFLTAITVLLGMKNARVEDLILEYYKRLGLLPPSPTTSLSLYYSSPFIAMIKKNLNFIEYRGVAYLGGTPYKTVKRVKMYKVLIVTVVVGIITYLTASLLKSQSLAFIIESNVGIFAGIIVISFTAGSAFIGEPLWLNLSAMTPVEFARKYLLARTLTAFILFLPISISILLLNPLMSIGSLFVPLVSIYNASINARFNPTSTPYYSARVLFGRQLSLLSVIPIF